MTRTKFCCKSNEIGPPLSLKLEKGRTPAKALPINTRRYAMVTMFSPDGSKPRLMYSQPYLFLLNYTIFWLKPCTRLTSYIIRLKLVRFRIRDQYLFCFSLVQEKKWREIFKLITKRANHNREIIFGSH